MSAALSDVHVSRFEALAPPDSLKGELPLTEAAAATVERGRREVRAALHGQDGRLVVIVGPCSIHDPQAAIDYATRLATLRTALSEHLLVVMRVYFEKPRTTIGWKGLINDPGLDGSHDINLGLRRARQVLLQIAELGLPAATEFLDPIVPQYTADLVSWAAIGARTTESQTHREMASGLSMPVGFKNATDGDLQVAIDAMRAAQHAHSFLGIDQRGVTSIVRTRGNPDVHVILRGREGKPNYTAPYVAFAKAMLDKGAPRRPIMIDCSHGNSGKDYRKQPTVMDDVVAQRRTGESAILGVMLESHLHEGNQPLGAALKYGVSITDSCLGWEATERLLVASAEALAR